MFAIISKEEKEKLDCLNMFLLDNPKMQVVFEKYQKDYKSFKQSLKIAKSKEVKQFFKNNPASHEQFVREHITQ